MVQFSYTVTDPEGLHVRNASYLMHEVRKHKCQIKLVKDGKVADAKNVFETLDLVIKQGDTIMLTFEGEGEKESAEEVENRIKEFL